MAGPQQHFASLYVGDLNRDVTEAVLFEVFNPVGPVASIRVCRDSVTRKSLGYAYVNFHNVKDAERALDTLNYSSIKDRSCRIMWSHRDPAMRKAGAGNIFVKNLDKSIDNKALFDTFSLFGNILSCKVASDFDGVSKGYGFVHYESPEAAQQAINKVDGMEIGTNTVNVSLCVKQEREDTKSTNVYVKHFPTSWDEAALLAHFAPIGAITSSVLMHDKKGRPYAFINYEDADVAGEAIDKLHNMDLKDQFSEDASGDAEERMLFVGRAQTKAEREADLRKERAAQQGVCLYIKNLDESIDDAKLYELFAPYGDVKSARVIKDDAAVSKGFGFVSYASPGEATKAVTEMHLKSVLAKPLYVGLAERRQERQDRLESRFRAPKGKGKGKGPMGMSPMGMMGNMGGMYGMPPQMMQMQMQMQQQMQRPNPNMGSMPMPGMMAMMGKGMGMRPQQQQPPQQQQQQPTGMTGLNPSALAQAPPGMQKQMIGEKLHTAISAKYPDLAGKITGMMLEMDNAELLLLLESPHQLQAKVDEARRVLGM